MRVLTYFFMLAVMYAFLANRLFFFISGSLTVPEQRLTRTPLALENKLTDGNPDKVMPPEDFAEFMG